MTSARLLIDFFVHLPLLHQPALLFQSSAWDEDALDRSKQQYLSFYRCVTFSAFLVRTRILFLHHWPGAKEQHALVS